MTNLSNKARLTLEDMCVVCFKNYDNMVVCKVQLEPCNHNICDRCARFIQKTKKKNCPVCDKYFEVFSYTDKRKLDYTGSMFDISG